MTQEREYQGGKISEPGCYSGIPIDQYHGDPDLLDGFSISSTGVRAVDRRPSEFWCTSIYNPDRLDEDVSDDTKDQIFGRAAHHLLLGEAAFSEHFAIRPETYPDRKTGEAKKWTLNADWCKSWVSEQAEAGRAVLSDGDIDKIKRMRDSLARHPIVQAGALNGRVERSLFAKVADIWLKARPDVIPGDGSDFVDLKTARAVDDDSLSKAIFNAGYHVQGAVVRMVWRELGYEFGSFVLAFLEKKAPYEVRFFEVRTQDLDLGERQARSAIRTVKECLKRGEWPGYDGFDPSVLNIDIPAWARTRIDTGLAQKEAA